MITQHPQFAVVGHPNKGKSSIVSALAHDDSVQVSNTPGTTTKCRSFPLSVDGKILYELFDTPGFQRARRILAWLKQHEVRADKRPDIVRSFINQHRHDERFNDEIELLEPIMQGAGIIYVVDGSKPYGAEYEAEMEILRWTGQPSMALLNHIDNSDYSDDWERALGQYFKMVRRFNPMKATYAQHLGILESMAQLKEEWIEDIKISIELFTKHHNQKIERSASLIAKLLYQSISLVDRLNIKDEEATKEEKADIESKYKESLRELEIKTQEGIKAIWKHKRVQIEQNILPFNGIDLFSKESASIFGLSKKELTVMGITSGAITGATIDLLFVGHTFFIGGAIGAVVGGTGAYFGFDELSEVQLLGSTLGTRHLEIGPMKNRNFPFILIGRALYHTSQIANRSHASRQSIDIDIHIDLESVFKEKWLNDERRDNLEKYHKKFRQPKDIEPEILKEYDGLIKDGLVGLLSS
ncbi:MAG: DUF3482 domain-containing protein [Sulfurovum sp.]